MIAAVVMMFLLQGRPEVQAGDALLKPKPPVGVVSTTRHAPIQLAIPSETPVVPSVISPLEYEQHMSFQKSEDNLQSQIDKHDLRLGTLEDQRTHKDRPDIDSLQETRTNLRDYRDFAKWLFGGSTLLIGILGTLTRRYWWPWLAKTIVSAAAVPSK